MPDSARFCFGAALAGSGATVAVIGMSPLRLIAAGLVLAGLVLAMSPLVRRERAFCRSHPPPRRTNWIADALVVIVSAIAGVLASGGNELAWCASALVLVAIVWWCRPGMMSPSSKDRRSPEPET